MNIDTTKLGKAVDLSIPLRFNGPQPNAYGVPAAYSSACESDDLVGDTRRGGSCNFEQITLIPHCNGTHTECVGHITNERISVRECLRDVFMRTVLVTVEAENVGADRVITERVLGSLKGNLQPPATAGGSDSLIIRTLPNGEGKLTALYDGDNMPPYFSAEAMELIVASGFKHLLVDLPSIDRLFDDGKLVNHRIFWNIEPGSFEANSGTRIGSTITEMIFVPNDVPDGEYLLNLQIAPFEADAAPSRPVIFPLVR